MNSFNNLRIGMRLGLGFALTIVAMLFIAGYARVTLSHIKIELDLLTGDRIVKVEQLHSVKDNINIIARSVRNIALLSDEKRIQDEARTIEQARASNGDLLKKLDASIKSEKGVMLLKAATDARSPYNSAVEKVIALGVAGKRDEATSLLLGDLRAAQRTYLEKLADLSTLQMELMKQADETVDATVTRASMLMMIIALSATVIGALAAWLVARSITIPIRQAVTLAETVARGDLRSDIKVYRRDETGQLLGALMRMNDALVRTVSAVRGNADSVATASSQIAQGNIDLSQRTEEQASNLQQTAASMEQLTATVKQNADTARQASQLASGASTVAGRGGDVVDRVVSTMEDISASSKKIADIIGVIDGIAFQTNILALNAAVEAARAGEQGRGFAVVAGEVRSLAQRSAEAAKEIKSLIGASVDKVEAGSALVGDAGRTMGEIVSQVKRVSDLLGEISAASAEQTSGIGQIGDAVTQLDQVTQQNAALVEQSAAAAESLKAQATQLAQAVAFFTLSEQSDTPTSAKVETAARRVTPASSPRVERTQGPAAGRVASPAQAPRKATAVAGTDDWASF